MVVRIGLIGDYGATVTAHVAIPKALELCARSAGAEVEATWLPTETISRTALSDFDGLWSVPATPYRDTDGALTAIRFARESERPFLGTCGGFQHALIEYARNVLGISGADHAETNPEGGELILTQLACSMVEVEETIRVLPGTKLAGICGASELREGYHCRFGLNPKYLAPFEAAGVRVSAVSPEGEVRAMEWPGDAFFMGVLFQPERWALKGLAHPLVTAFVGAASAAGRRVEASANRAGN